MERGDGEQALKRTPLYEEHRAAGAKLVDFAGWEMPLHYGSQIDEHHTVRQAAGLFDVSHMAVVDVTGSGALAWLQGLLANDAARLVPGKALYSCMLNETGGVLDDLIVYHRGDAGYRVVVNAGTRDKDLAWMRGRLGGAEVTLTERTDLAMIAAQGPLARERVHGVLGEAAQTLGRFQAMDAGEMFVARTGYTGEDGYEIMLPAVDAPELWRALVAADIAPIGLGARDTLRLEAGMNLYGQEMDEQTTPLEAGLAWTVAWEPADRDFIGRAALEAQRAAGVPRRLVGLVLEDRGVLRAHQTVFTDAGEGEVTSGGFSPTLNRSIAFARVPGGFSGERCEVEVRGRRLAARVVAPPFVRDGQPRIKL